MLNVKMLDHIMELNKPIDNKVQITIPPEPTNVTNNNMILINANSVKTLDAFPLPIKKQMMFAEIKNTNGNIWLKESSTNVRIIMNTRIEVASIKPSFFKVFI